MTQVIKKEEGIVIEVRETTRDVEKMRPYLVSTWCKCTAEEYEFLCYPEDGCCTCGIHKHHVHCANCGGVSQVG